MNNPVLEMTACLDIVEKLVTVNSKQLGGTVKYGSLNLKH